MRIIFDQMNRECVSGRDLHALLGIETDYNEWFTAMKKYCIEEGSDYTTVIPNTSPLLSNAAHQKTDHLLTLNTANELVMLQTTRLSRHARKLLVEIFTYWFDPIKLGMRTLELLSQYEPREETAAGTSEEETGTGDKHAHDDTINEKLEPLSISEIAREYHLSGIRLNKILEKMGVQTRVNGAWSLCPDYQNWGYVVYEPHGYLDHEGKHHESLRMKWTPCGKLFIHHALKKLGIHPAVEA